MNPAVATAAGLGSRPPIERLRYLAERLRSGKVVNAPLCSEHWEMSVKTLQRDLDFLRDRLGYRLEWNALRRSFVLLSAPEPQL